SGWGKNLASSLPSVQVILPARWRKNLHTNKRCRKSTSLWVARSKATNSMTEASSFQQRNASRYNSKTSTAIVTSRNDETPLPNGGPTSPNGDPTPPNGAPTPTNGDTPPHGDDDASPAEEEPCGDDDSLLPLPLGNALPPPPPPPDMVAPAPPRTPALRTLRASSSFQGRRGVTTTTAAAVAAATAAPAKTHTGASGVAAAAAAAPPPAAPARVWEWGDDPVNPYRINAGRGKGR
ncbi:unnamed protein product, partial [Laminaria digitata]